MKLSMKERTYTLRKHLYTDAFTLDWAALHVTHKTPPLPPSKLLYFTLNSILFISFTQHCWLLTVLKITVIKGGTETFQSLCWIRIHTSSVKEGWPQTCLQQVWGQAPFWRISLIYHIHLFWVNQYIPHSERNWEASHPVQEKSEVLVSKVKWFCRGICGDKLPTYLP